MTLLIPPQPTLKWTHTPEEVLSITKDLIAENTKFLDKIAAIPPEQCSFKSVFLALALQKTHFHHVLGPLQFYQNVSPSKALRDASNQVEILIDEHGVENSMRIDVFRAKQAAEENIKKTGKQLSAEERRLVEKMIQDGTRAGLALPEEKRNKLVELQKELSQTCSLFGQNINNDNSTISFKLEELEGVPKDVISGYTKRIEGDEELYEVTFKDPDIYPIIQYADIPETRKRACEAFGSRTSTNVPVVDKFLELRRQIASILGFDNWADHVTEIRMVKNAKTALEFLDDLEQKMRPIALKEREVLLAIKAEDCKAKGIPFDGEFYHWDNAYYGNKFTEKTLNLDSVLIRDYFPVSHVVPTIMEIYQDLLGVKFVKVEGETWHPDVQQFAVWDKDAKDESGFIGYTYLDILPREFKHQHPSMWDILPGYTKPDGTRNHPVTAMVAGLAKPTADKPAILRHWDVVMLFHEMGHVFHGLLSVTKFSRFHGTSVVLDFCEAPSQMLENWCWEPRILEMMSSHYETKQSMPSEMIEKLVKSRYSNIGLFYQTQLRFAKFDLQIHIDTERRDVNRLWNEMRDRIALLKGGEKDSPGYTNFGHIAGDYSAGYYSYTYSLVFAADMYDTVFKKDPLDPVSGKRYREKLLRPGSSQDELVSLEDFLGRPPSSDAFIKQLFGDVEI